MNIVFDLGGVVLRWEPGRLLAQFFPDELDREIVMQQIIAHPDWIEFDRGTIQPEDVAERGAARTGLAYTDIFSFLTAIPSSLTPIAGSVEIIRELHSSGLPLYVLSNMSKVSWSYISEKLDIWNYFSGISISCLLGAAKPDPTAFSLLQENHGIAPEDTLFIDDTAVNITAADQHNFRTLRFSSPDQCRRDLAELGLITEQADEVQVSPYPDFP